MSATEFRNWWRRLNDQGMRVIDVEICPSEGPDTYAAVWRQHSPRYEWGGRVEAEQALNAFLAQNPMAPGVSAAI
jgi:hypothetical protein